MSAGARRSVIGCLVVLVTLLSGAVVSVGPLAGAAAAEGEIPPQITGPEGTDPLYTGFTGPFTVNFTYAQHTTYTWTLTRQPGGASVGSGTIVWDGSGDAVRTYSAPAPLTEGSYLFAVDGDPGLHAEKLVTVRGPQPRCSASLPSRVRINQPEEIVTARLAANCAAAAVSYASWDIQSARSQSFVNLIAFNRTAVDTFKFAASQPLGIYYARPNQASNARGDVILQNVPRTDVRLVSRFTLTATRTRGVVTLQGRLTRYTPRALGLRGWAGRKVVVQTRRCGTCPWRTIAARTTTATGRLTVRVRAASARGYRLTTIATPTVWAPTPVSVRR